MTSRLIGAALALALALTGAAAAQAETVKRGQIIAKSGQSGEVSSPQLHFEIRKGSSPVDPLQFLNGA